MGSPLVGGWTEYARLECGTGLLMGIAEQRRIREIEFRSDGSFSVTWHPFETFHDYWGAFSGDPEGGRLHLAVRGGNYVPADLDGEGTYEMSTGLRLADMTLGSGPYGSVPAPVCGHILVRPRPVAAEGEP